MKSLSVCLVSVCLALYLSASVIDGATSTAKPKSSTAKANRCYRCTSETHPVNCLDPFNSTNMPTCTGAQCIKVYSSSGKVTVTRDCLKGGARLGCNTSYVADTTVKTCNCEGDLCNTGIIDHSALPLALQLMITAILCAVALF